MPPYIATLLTYMPVLLFEFLTLDISNSCNMPVCAIPTNVYQYWHELWPKKYPSAY